MAGFGGLKRIGFSAKGIPRNWLTLSLESGMDVEVPIMIPLSMVAVGLLAVLDCGSASVAPA